MANYDMSPLDADERVQIRIHIINENSSINELELISISTDANVTELKYEIAKTLSIQQQHQEALYIKSTTDSKATIELSEPNKKLSEYEISSNSIIELKVTDDCNLNATNTIYVDGLGQINLPKKSDEETAAKQEKVTAVDVVTDKPSPSKKSTRSASEKAAKAQETIHSLTKHSKIQCRILLIVFEITLVLLVIYWGTMSMIQYIVNMIFVLIAWRGCRKLRPGFIIIFLGYLAFDIVILLFLIIFGLIESHESVYGSTAGYIVLLSFEFLLNCIWFYFYCKFAKMVMVTGKSAASTLEMARKVTSKQPILI